QPPKQAVTFWAFCMRKRCSSALFKPAFSGNWRIADAPGVPNPKLVAFCGRLLCEPRLRKDTRNLMILVWLSFRSLLTGSQPNEENFRPTSLADRPILPAADALLRTCICNILLRHLCALSAGNRRALQEMDTADREPVVLFLGRAGFCVGSAPERFR